MRWRGWTGRARRGWPGWTGRPRAKSAGAFELRAREETRESRGMPCLFLNTERVLAENHPKNRGFVGISRGQKCLRDVFHGDLLLESGLAARVKVGIMRPPIPAITGERDGVVLTIFVEPHGRQI